MKKQMTVLCGSTALFIALSSGAVAQTAQTLLVGSSAGYGADPYIASDILPEVLLDQGADYAYSGFISRNANTAFGSVETSSRAMGYFYNGAVQAGTYLPDENQPDPQNPTAVYAGGIGLLNGICLSTGALTDDDPVGGGVGTGRGVGVEGPNNGTGVVPTNINEGEIGTVILGASIVDQDFDEHVFDGELTINPLLAESGDPVVLVFQIELQRPGFLRVRWVFGSDEYPAWILGEYNDSFAILIKKDACANSEFENIAIFKEPTDPNPMPFSLQALEECGPPFFKVNQLTPAPFATSGPDVSPHAIDDTPGAEPHEYGPSVPLYDHEFAGFTKPLISETPVPLSVGIYTIKIVVHDVGDAGVDSALFLEQKSLKLFSLNPGDFNGDGIVDAADYAVWEDNLGKTPATFYDGDGNGDCVVDGDDYTIWYNRLGQAGNRDVRADFNRDGCVDLNDFSILHLHHGHRKVRLAIRGGRQRGRGGGR